MIRQPEAQKTGPGSSSYAHARVGQRLIGEGADACWIYTPQEPQPKSAPLVLFLHGWRATNPRDYGAWISHIVRRGSIVLYPVFEKTRMDDPEAMMKAAIAASVRALEDLRRSGPVRPDESKFAILGHSLGGGLTMQIAARSKASGLPEPKALMPTQPGWRGSDVMPTERLREISPSALLLLVVGDTDQFEKNRQTEPIYRATPQIPAGRKAIVALQSDSHGSEPLVADHGAPLAPDDEFGQDFTRQQERRRKVIEAISGMGKGKVDALDYNGFWKLFDALVQAAWNGKTIDAVVGESEIMSMGRWSDGTPVRPPVRQEPK
jgi:acetyl esterase/lipase